MRIVKRKYIGLPFLDIAHNTFPSARYGRCEYEIILSRKDRFKTEDLNVRTGFTLEMQTGRDNLGIVEYHYRILRQKIRDFAEYMFAHRTVPVFKKFGSIPPGQRIFRNPFVRKGIVIVIYTYLRNHYLHQI